MKHLLKRKSQKIKYFIKKMKTEIVLIIAFLTFFGLAIKANNCLQNKIKIRNEMNYFINQ